MSIQQAEYERRLRRTRRAMTEAGLDALLVYSWKRGGTRYLTGYYPNYVANVAAALLPLEGESTLFIRFPFDLERARRTCWFADVRASGGLRAVGRDAAQRLRELGLQGGRIGLVDGDETIRELPYELYADLRASLPDAEFVDACPLLLDIRLLKSPAECGMLRRSARVTDRAVAAAGEALAPGVAERDVIAAAEAAARSVGASQCLVVIAGDSSRDLIGPPRDRALGSDRAVIVEAAAEVGGYWTQVARTFPVGQPTAEPRAIYTAVRRAYAAAVGACRQGTVLGQVSRAATEVLEQAGYAADLEHDIGHGIGLDLPEPPNVDAASGHLLEEGAVVVLHPSVRVWGVGGAFVGGTVLLTADGPEAIHQIPERLL